MNLLDIINFTLSTETEEGKVARDLILDLVWVCDIAFHKMAETILPGADEESIESYINGVVHEAQYEYASGFHADVTEEETND